MLESKWSRVGLLFAVLGPLAFSCCERHFEDWAPPLEEASTQRLRVEAQQALTLLQGTREHLTADPARADRDLEGAEAAMLRLTEYYLPLLEAREHAHNAHLLLCAGKITAVHKELDDTRRILEHVAEQDGPQLARELETPLSDVEEARGAAGEAPEEASNSLSLLVDRLSHMILKGDLILPRSGPAQRGLERGRAAQ